MMMANSMQHKTMTIIRHKTGAMKASIVLQKITFYMRRRTKAIAFYFHFGFDVEYNKYYILSVLRGAFTMAIIRSTVKVGQKPSAKEMRRIEAELMEAEKYPIVYKEDCPESTPEALKEFAMLAAERNRRKKKQSVTIRLVPDCLSKYKTLGKGYTGIMADVLKYVADNPKLLKEACNQH